MRFEDMIFDQMVRRNFTFFSHQPRYIFKAYVSSVYSQESGGKGASRLKTDTSKLPRKEKVVPYVARG